MFWAPETAKRPSVVPSSRSAMSSGALPESSIAHRTPSWRLLATSPDSSSALASETRPVVVTDSDPQMAGRFRALGLLRRAGAAVAVVVAPARGQREAEAEEGRAAGRRIGAVWRLCPAERRARDGSRRPPACTLGA